MDIDLAVDLNGLPLGNPVLAASGTFGYGLEFKPYLDLNKLGGFVTKGISVHAHEGNPTPRIFETASGMLNSIGLQNIGAGCFIREQWPELQRLKTLVVVNIWGKTVEEYVRVSQTLEAAGVKALEVNISCPNIKEGGVQFGKDPVMVHQIVSELRKAVSCHLMIKLSPNVSDIALIAKAAEEGGADSLSVINTLHGMAVNVETREPELGSMYGGLSGPAILPVALYMVDQSVRAVSIPIIGIGGIFRPEDAIQFFLVGAAAVQVGTYNFINPAGTLEILEGIRKFCIEKEKSPVFETLQGRWNSPIKALHLLLIFFLLSCAGTPHKIKHEKGETQTGMASWYGPKYHGRKTASGEVYNMYDLTAAHQTLPFGATVHVRNLENDKTVIVKINDRGPFKKKRIIDLSYEAAKQLDMIGEGTARVKITILE